METNLDDLLVALYVHLTDHVLTALGWNRDKIPGRKPKLADADLLCLVVAQRLLQFDSERRWIRYAKDHYSQWFPHIPGQSGYGKRVRRQSGLISAVMAQLAMDTPSWHETTRLLDSTPIPAASSRETVKRSDLAGDAGYGYCASHSRYFWGFRLYLITTLDGLPLIWGLANPKIGERDVTQALIEHDPDLIRRGDMIIADKGFAGVDFEAFITDRGATLIRPDRKDETPRFGNIAHIRQRIEATIDTLKGQCRLEHHGGRTLTGLYAHIASCLLAMTAAIWNNHRIDLPIKRSLIAYDH